MYHLRFASSVGLSCIGAIVTERIVSKSRSWSVPQTWPLPHWVFDSFWMPFYICMGLADYDVDMAFYLAVYTTDVLLNWAWPSVCFAVRKLTTIYPHLLIPPVFSTARAILCALLIGRMNLTAAGLLVPSRRRGAVMPLLPQRRQRRLFKRPTAIIIISSRRRSDIRNFRLRSPIPMKDSTNRFA